MNWKFLQNKHLPPHMIVVIAILTVVIAFLFVISSTYKLEEGTVASPNTLVGNIVEAINKAKIDSEARLHVPEEPELKMVPLQEEINSIIGQAVGDWSVTVIDLGSGDRFSIESKRMYSASLIKLYIMGAVFQAIEEGRFLYTEEVEFYVKSMITFSDNDASDWLVETALGGGDAAAGMDVVNTFIKTKGYKDTEQGQLFGEIYYTEDTLQDFTSSKDCAEFLEAIYRRQCVSPGTDSLMLEILKAQLVTVKIPMGLPAGTPTANKTGELWNVENDAAIIFSPAGDYVLCVMSNNTEDSDAAIDVIIQISAATYAYFNPQPVE